MSLYDNFLSKKYFSPSVGPILFGKSRSLRDFIILGTPSDSVQVAYTTCLTFASFIQMYYISKARNNGTTISTINLDETVSDRIRRFWNCDGDVDFSDSQLFSFLISASSDRNIMSPDAKSQIIKVRTCYSAYKNNYKAGGAYDYSDLEKLLDSFILLRDITFENGYFNISKDNTVYSIKSEPFIFFLDRGTVGNYEDPSTTCNILTSVKKGDRNHEIFVVAEEINSLNSSGKKREICCQIEQEGNLDIIFHSVGVSSKWYDTEGYLGDYTFLNNLIDCSKIAAKKYFSKIKGYISPVQDMFSEIVNLFEGTELYDKLTSSHEKQVFINDESESFGNFLFEVFINYGVCNTLTALLFNENEETGLQLFDSYMSAFEDKNIISHDEKISYMESCRNCIDQRAAKLTSVLDKNSKGFKHRQREIEAEWRTYFILHAAGIKNERLFADVESILSIDDYFDMIKNPQASLEDSLKNVLTFLSSFYSALLNNYSKINYSKFARDFKSKKKEILSSSPTVKSMLDTFLEVVRSSVNNKVLYNVTNRQRVCIPEHFEDYAQSIKEELEKQKEMDEFNASAKVTLNQGDRVFISYSHDDKPTVDKIVRLLKDANLNVYYDTDKFYGGANWKEKATKEIQSSECKVMLAFTSKSSIKKEAVEFELSCMSREKKPIIPVNLEIEPINDYLTIAKYDYNKDKNGATIAGKIASILPDSLIFLSAKDVSDKNKEFKPDIAEDIVKSVNEAINDYKKEFRVHSKGFSPLELAVANLYAFLKTSDYKRYNSAEELSAVFESEENDLSKCIYPLIASVKETQIRRDNITLLGYELIAGKNRTYKNINYILTSRKLKADDYYCLPKCRYVGNKCQWMVEPLLIRSDDLAEQVN